MTLQQRQYLAEASLVELVAAHELSLCTLLFFDRKPTIAFYEKPVRTLYLPNGLFALVLEG
jgi:hypothetical protein